MQNSVSGHLSFLLLGFIGAQLLGVKCEFKRENALPSALFSLATLAILGLGEVVGTLNTICSPAVCERPLHFSQALILINTLH